MPGTFIDDGKWQSLVEDLGAEARDLAVDFCADMRANLDQMEQALSAGDLDTLGRLAHSSKSSSAIFGAVLLSQLCLQLEQAAKQAEPGLGERTAQVRRAFVLTEKEMQQRLLLIS